MMLANIGYDLQAFSKGRFILGLGSQIKPHITKRFSMPWSHPAPRMREMILAIRAIWDCWNNGTKLDFRGDFYTHTLMTPFFNPGPRTRTAMPKVFLAGVGELMTEVAGEVCDGFLCHGFTHRALPPRGDAPGARAGPGQGGQDDGGLRDRRPVASSSPARNEEEMAAAADGHPPADRLLRLDAGLPGVLELHGWGGLQDELNALSKQGKWVEMGDAHRRRDPQHVRRRRRARGDRARAARAATATCIQRISFYAPYQSDPDRWRGVIAALQAA